MGPRYPERSSRSGGGGSYQKKGQAQFLTSEQIRLMTKTLLETTKNGDFRGHRRRSQPWTAATICAKLQQLLIVSVLVMGFVVTIVTLHK